jgi:hypothetical protein
MAVGEKDSVTLWSLESGEVLQELQGVLQTCNCVLLTPDAKLLVTAGYTVLSTLSRLHSSCQVTVVNPKTLNPMLYALF